MDMETLVVSQSYYCFPQAPRPYNLSQLVDFYYQMTISDINERTDAVGRNWLCSLSCIKGLLNDFDSQPALSWICVWVYVVLHPSNI